MWVRLGLFGCQKPRLCSFFFVTAVSPVLFMDQFSEAKGQVVSNKENDRENIEKSINDMDSIILERE